MSNKNQIIQSFGLRVLLENSFRILFIASSESGKTTIVQYMLAKAIYKQYKYVFLVVGSDTKAYEGFVWPNCKFRVTSTKMFNTAIEEIILFASELTTLIDHLPETNIANKILVIIDDTPSFMSNSGSLQKLFSFGRNSGISILCMVQYYTQLDPHCRQNITHLITFEYMESTLETLVKKNMGITIPSKQFIEIIRQICNKKTKYTAVVISLKTTNFPITTFIVPKEFVDTAKEQNILKYFYSPLMAPRNSSSIVVHLNKT